MFELCETVNEGLRGVLVKESRPAHKKQAQPLLDTQRLRYHGQTRIVDPHRSIRSRLGHPRQERRGHSSGGADIP